MRRLKGTECSRPAGPPRPLSVVSQVGTELAVRRAALCAQVFQCRPPHLPHRGEDQAGAGAGGDALLIQDAEGATEKPLPSVCLRPRARCESATWSLSSPPTSPPRRHLERSRQHVCFELTDSWSRRFPGRAGPTEVRACSSGLARARSPVRPAACPLPPPPAAPWSRSHRHLLFFPCFSPEEVLENSPKVGEGRAVICGQWWKYEGQGLAFKSPSWRPI